MTTSPSCQRGLSMPFMIFLLLVVVAGGTFGMKTAPAYLDYNTIDGAIQSALSEPKLGLKSKGEIRQSIAKRLQINNVEVIDKDEIRIDKGGGRVLASIDYQVRKDLVANIDVVMDFQKEYEQSLR
jgi:hypothetical protein